jgi:hypothetical protein
VKLAIWGVFGLLAGLWTAGAFIAAELTQWAAQLVATGAANDLGQAAARWPVPSWLAFWVDPAWVQTMQSMTLWTLEALREGMPFIGSALGWLVPIVWLVWGVGALCLLALAVLAHWLSSRTLRSLQGRFGGAGAR